MKKILSKIKKIKIKEIIPVLIVFGLAVAAGWHLTKPGYFNMHDDLQMMRQLEMEKCFLDGQIPCRWVPDMGYGFGFPLFNYYPPLPYLVGQLFRLIGFSFMNTVKAVFLLTFILSGLTMYFLSRKFWGRLGGIISSAFYIWAPYHALDIYVRGAMNEAFAMIWFPLILLSAYQVIKTKKFMWTVILALAWFGLFLSHNLMVLIFLPLFAAWLVFWFLALKNWSSLISLASAGLWSSGLSAFFIIPVLMEKKLVQIHTLTNGYYNYIVHFVSLNQLLISRFWGYGASTWKLTDDMSFQIGHLHWILSLLLALLLGWQIIKKKFKKVNINIYIGLFFLASGWMAAFMTHARSIFIWKAVPPLRFVQFPWRFTILSTLSFSMLAGIMAYLMKEKIRKSLQWIFAGLLIIFLIVLGKDYFKPERMGLLTDEQKFSGLAWDKLQTAGIFDYLPNTAQTAPKAPQKNPAEIIKGKGKIIDARQGTDWMQFTAHIEVKSASVQIGILQFPNWRVFVDGQEVKTYVGEDEWGRMHIDLKKGKHKVYVKLFDTWPRKAGNLISIISWGLLITSPLWQKLTKKS